LGEESLALARELEDERGIALSCMHLSDVALRRGELDRAARLASEALELHRGLGDLRPVTLDLINLGFVALGRGRLDEALEGVGCVAAGESRLEEAARSLGAAAGLRERIEAPLTPDELAMLEPSVATVRDALGAERYDSAYRGGRSEPLADAVSAALELGSPPQR